jgi:hypothetical protein
MSRCQLSEVVKIGDDAVETFGSVADNGHVIVIEEDLGKFEEFVTAKMLLWSLPLTVFRRLAHLRRCS